MFGATLEFLTLSVQKDLQRSRSEARSSATPRTFNPSAFTTTSEIQVRTELKLFNVTSVLSLCTKRDRFHAGLWGHKSRWSERCSSETKSSISQSKWRLFLFNAVRVDWPQTGTGKQRKERLQKENQKNILRMKTRWTPATFLPADCQYWITPWINSPLAQKYYTEMELKARLKSNHFNKVTAQSGGGSLRKTPYTLI